MLTEKCYLKQLNDYFVFVTANLRMKVDIKTKYIKDNKGVNHFSLKNYKYTFDYGDRVSFELENLFKESKELSKYNFLSLKELVNSSTYFGNLSRKILPVSLVWVYSTFNVIETRALVGWLE